MTATIRVNSVCTGNFDVKPSDKIRLNMTIHPQETQSCYMTRGDQLTNVGHTWQINARVDLISSIGISVRKMHMMKDDLIGVALIDINSLDRDRLIRMSVPLRPGKLCPVEYATLDVEVCVSEFIETGRLAGQTNMLIPIY